MAERIHGGVVFAEGVFFRVAVPAFPDAGGAVNDLVAPRRELAALEEAHREIVVSVGAEHGQQRLGAQETGGHAATVFRDFIRQPIRRGLDEIVGQQFEGKGQYVCGLGVHSERTIGLRVFFIEGIFNVREKPAVIGGSGLTSDGLGHLGHHPAGGGKVAGVDVFDGGGFVQVEPVAPRIANRNAQVAGVGSGSEIHKAGERIVMPLDDSSVAIDAKEGPGTDDAGIGPSRAKTLARFAMAHGVRAVIRIGTEAALRFFDVVHPFCEEGGDIGVVTGGADINLRVTHPAEPFVALRAVGGQFNEIGALRPANVAKELVHDLVGAGE